MRFKFVLAVCLVFSFFLVTGCVERDNQERDNQNTIQGLLNMQCEALMNEDLEGYFSLFETSATRPELVEEAKHLLNFSIESIKDCRQKAILPNERGSTATVAVDVYRKLEVDGQVKEDTFILSRIFVKIDGKWYERSFFRMDR